MFIFGRAKAAALLNLRYYPAAIGSAFRKCVGDAYHGRVRFTARLKKKKKKNKEEQGEKKRGATSLFPRFRVPRVRAHGKILSRVVSVAARIHVARPYVDPRNVRAYIYRVCIYLGERGRERERGWSARVYIR